MKTNLKLLIIILLFRFSGAQAQENMFPKITQVNYSDTIIFDMSQSVINGADISFPVLISSDDTINAMDFSFRYNQSGLLYDSIADITNYLSALSFYNPNDSVVRFTSNSFQQYSNHVPLLRIYFTKLSGSIDVSDFNSLKAYLNGGVCTLTIIPPVSTGLINLYAEDDIKVFPNPCKNYFVVESKENADIGITDMNGRIISMQYDVSIFPYFIDTREIDSGMYFLNVYVNKKIISKRIVVE